jgi:hypothetical protein
VLPHERPWPGERLRIGDDAAVLERVRVDGADTLDDRHRVAVRRAVPIEDRVVAQVDGFDDTDWRTVAALGADQLAAVVAVS